MFDVRFLSVAMLAAVSLATLGCGSQNEPGDVAGTADTETATSGIGPIHAPSGAEETVCVHKRLGNREAGFVRQLRGSLSDGSHHMIVYVSDETQEQLTPRPCGGFSGILVLDGGIPGLDSKNIPIFIAQQKQMQLQMPDEDGVPIGFRIEKDQMLRVEMHWANAGNTAREITGALELDYIPDSAKQHVIESSFAFWGTLDIAIPPAARVETRVLFQRSLSDTKGFAVTTHQHRLGTRMRIWASDGSPGTDDKSLLADGTDWAEPPLEMLSPALTFGPGEGLAYQCEWNNTTSKLVDFGEEVGQEMCFLWMYYYPSLGFDICVHFNSGSLSGVCNHLVR